MKHNYHSHTPWSHHASIEAEDSVKKAISLGFKTWGLSEHFLQEDSSSDFRLRNWEELDGFVKEAIHLKDKYKKDIDIKIGIEFDYRHDDTGEPQIDFLKKVLDKYTEIEYVLYAPHFYTPWRHSFNVYPTKEEMKQFVQDIKDAFAEFQFAYIVHPDGYTKGMKSWTEDAEYLAEEITTFAAENNIPLGLNANGLGYGVDFAYPRPEFWKIASKNGVKAVLELDSHSDRSISKERTSYIEDMARETGVYVIEKLDI